jgi:cytochrome c oxidase subunit 2
VIGLARCAETARAAEPLTSLAAGSWNDWWINTNYAEHGESVDQIFLFIFWLTTAILIVVQVVLVWFMIKYRHRDGAKKAVYSHGNTRLEMVWTLIPAVILIVVALWTKRVWDNYRYSPIANDPNRLKVLVIGQQFNWNVIYPGPRGKIGRYLIYPKTTDLLWPKVPAGKVFKFRENVPGPAYLPEAKAQVELNKYIGEVNPLGRDYSDPDTDPLLPADRVRYDELANQQPARDARLSDLKDAPDHADRLEALRTKKENSRLNEKEQKLYDRLKKEADEYGKLQTDKLEFEKLDQIESLNDYANANGRQLIIPKGRPVEIQIGSRDVIHDFFLPNFRVRLDTVPGMRGKLYLTATKTAEEVGGAARDYTLDELLDVIKRKTKQDLVTAVIDASSPGAVAPGRMVEGKPLKYWSYVAKNGDTIILDGSAVIEKTVEELRAIGVSKLKAKVPFYWEIVCEELCGNGHAQMRGQLIVVTQDELRQGSYRNYYPRSK